MLVIIMYDRRVCFVKE